MGGGGGELVEAFRGERLMLGVNEKTPLAVGLMRADMRLTEREGWLGRRL